MRSGKVQSYTKNYQRRKLWQRIVSMLTCIVVFCTTYALILPALTASADAICGMEEHFHTDSCYTWIETAQFSCDIHTHSAECCDEEENLICGMADHVLHTHSELCFGEDGSLLCELAEMEEHVHTEACYEEQTVRTDEEHIHDDSCYTVQQGTLTCEHEETEGHCHTEDCYGQSEVLLCEWDGTNREYVLICSESEVEPHIHEEGCYETVLDENGEEAVVLTCSELQVLVHTHSDECMVKEVVRGELICAEEEHLHESACYSSLINLLGSMLLADGEEETTGDSGSDTSTTTGSTSILDLDADFKVAFSNTSFNPYNETYDVDLKLTFKFEKEDEIFQAIKNGTYDAFHITLPDNMVIPDDLLNTVRYATDNNKGGIIAFDYWFEKTSDGQYVIHIEFRDEYVDKMIEDNSNGEYEITFEGTVDKNAVTDNGDIALKWSDGTTTTIGKDLIDYPDNETLNYDLHTQKQGSYNVKDDTLTYTVKVYSDKGTPSGNTISVTDTMTLNGITVADNTSPKVSVTDSSGNTVSGATSDYSTVDGKPTITTNLPALSAGEYYLITYTYSINEIAAGSNYWPYNSVTATVPNPENNEALTSTTGTTVTVSKQMISKSGIYDSESGTITWTITVNAAGDDITGYVLTDEMLQNALSLTITPEDTSYYTINRDSNNKISSIEFIAPEDETNTNTYTITYTTAQNQSTVGGYTSNNAVLTPPVDTETPSSTGDVNVWVPASGGIDKQYVSMDGSVLTWKVVVDIPDGGIGKGTVIKDNTGYSWDSKADNHWMTPAQIYALNETLSSTLSGIDYTLEFSADGWNWETYSEAIADRNTTEYYCWRITFNQDVPKSQLNSLVIQYSTTADKSKENTFVNSVKMGDYSDTDSTVYKPSVAKLDRYFNSGTTNISSTDGVIGWYIRITLDEEKSSIGVTDYLPAGVTLTKVGVGSDGNAAKSATTSADGTVYGWNNLMGIPTRSTYKVTSTDAEGNTVETDVEATQVDITITSQTSGQNIPAGDVYIYFECKIDDMPNPGESKTYSFTNHAVVDEVPVEQTQNVTVTVPATVVKMDSNGTTSDTTHNYGTDDNTLGWYVRVYLPEGADASALPVKITDTLPAGLKLTKIGIGNSMYNARYGVQYNSDGTTTDLCVSVGESTTGNIYGYSGSSKIYQSKYSISASHAHTDSCYSDGQSPCTEKAIQTVTVDVTNGGNAIAANSYIYIYYECEITEDAAGETSTEDLTTTTTYKFKNSVSVTIGDEPHGSDDHTQTIIKSDVQEEEKLVDKSFNFDADISQLQYTVLLNEKSEDLDSVSDTLTVVDVMTHDVDRWWNTKHSTLISSSVKLYEPLRDTAGNILYDSNGSPIPDLDKPIPSDQWSWTFSDNYEDVLNYKSDQIINTITATIPDEKAVVLTYIYAFDIESDWDTGFQVSNKVTLYGDSETTDEVTSYETWQYSSVTATATSTGTYTIHKVEQGNYNIVLSGAEFTVYTYNDDQPVLDANGNVVVYTSDSDGLVKVSNESYFLEDVVYYIKETKAPDGYFLPDDPIKVYFYFGSGNSSSLNLPTAGAVDLNDTFGVAYIENEEDNMSITVSKSWVDADGTTISAPDDTTKINFQLIQTDISGNEVTWFVAPENASDEQIAGKYYTITLVGGVWQSVTIPDLQAEDLDGNPYTYTVRELNVPDGYVSELSTDAEGNITITNRKKETTSISVQKAWHDADMEKEPVQVQLYRSVDTLFTDYTAYLCYIDGTAGLNLGVDTPFTVTQSITGAGTYTFRWDMNLFGFKDTNSAEAFYIDVVDPNFALEGYTITNLTIKTDKGTYSVNSDFKNYFSEHGGGYKRINFYNIYDDTLYMDVRPDISSTGYLEVSFTLVAPEDDENGGILPSLNEFVSAANTGGVAIGDPVTLDSPGWSHKWTNLPLTGVDSEGNLIYYSYYVKEITDGYEARYSNSYAIDEGTVIVTNYPKSTAELTVNKKWLDNTGKTIPAPENSVEYLLEMEELYTVTVNIGGWGYSNTNVQYLYVRPNTTVNVQFIGSDIVNNENYTLVSKESIGWIGRNGNWVELFKYEYSRTITDPYTTIGLNYGGYPELDSSGNKIFNSNGQEVWTGFEEGTYDLYDFGWDNGQVIDTIDLGSDITFTYDETNATIYFVPVGTFTLSEAKNWTNTHENLIPGLYRVTETTTGYTTTYIVGEGDAQTEAPELELKAGEEGEVTIINRLSTTSITVDKAWLDNGERYAVDMITFTLYQNGVEYSTGTLYMEKGEDGNYHWTTTIDNLPLADADGINYVYTVKENAIDGYYTTYSTDGSVGKADYTLAGVTGDGTITITNKRVTSIGVKKYWADGVSPTAVRMELWCYTSTTGAVEFQVPLDGNGQVDYEALKNTANASFVRYASICDSSGAENSTSSSSKTFKNLDLYSFNDDGTVKEYYTYFIVEVASGYAKTYTEDNFITGGSYSITNDIYKTSISVAKAWSDGSTTPVDVSLYQVFTPSADHECSFTAVTTDPTCTEQGYTTKTCECGIVEVTDYVAATGHSWNSGVVTVEPTEDTNGLKVYTCSVCRETKEEVLLPQHTHNYNYNVSVTTAATCTQAGVTTYTCSCGAYITEAKPAAAGHTFPDVWTVTTPATCTADGVQTQTCTVCKGEEENGVQTQTIAASHSWGEWQVSAATCTLAGSQTRTCSSCNQTETETISALGHSWCTCSTQSGSDSCSYCTYTAPTADTDGSIVRTCMRDGCTEKKTDKIPATGSGSSTATDLLESTVTIGSSWVDKTIDLTSFDLLYSSGGYFTFEYEITDTWGCVYIEFGYQQLKKDENRPKDKYVFVVSYDDLYDDVQTNLTEIKYGGMNLIMTKITWTPGTSSQSLDANAITLSNLAYYSDGTTSSSSNSLGGTFISEKQVVPGTVTTWTDLPKYKLDSNGNILGEYTYYVVETGGEEYDATYTYTDSTGKVTKDEMSTGIASGTITITNHQQYSYELPQSGGSGTLLYTLGGVLLLMAGGVVLMYNQIKGRKGVPAP